MTIQKNDGKYSGAGGAGSGGGITGASKDSLVIYTATVSGGKGGIANPLNQDAGTIQNGGDGGAGRARFDGPTAANPAVIPIQASQYRGPSTDTSEYVARTFTLTGTGNGQTINIYIKPEAGAWQLAATVSNYPSNPWSQTIALPGSDSLYFLAAAQQVPNPDTARYTMEPSWVFSQAAANILRIAAPAKNAPQIAASVAGFATLGCDSVTYSDLTIRNTGADTLRIDTIVFTLDNEGFSLAPPAPTFPIFIAPGADTNITIAFAPDSAGMKIAVLVVKSDAFNAPVLTLNLAGQKDSIADISASVTMGSDSAKPGDTVYLPVVVRSLNGTPLSGLSYRVRVRYDGSILLPIGVRGGTLDTVGNGMAILTVNDEADTAYLVCIAALGDTTATPVVIDTVEWGTCAAQTVWTDGAFTLAGLCAQGGTRLFFAADSLALAQNAPNPFSGETVIRYRTIENGETRLWVADVLGRTVAALANGYQKAGAHAAIFDGSGLQTGMYFYILQTPAQIVRKTMVVEK